MNIDGTTLLNYSPGSLFGPVLGNLFGTYRVDVRRLEERVSRICRESSGANNWVETSEFKVTVSSPGLIDPADQEASPRLANLPRAQRGQHDVGVISILGTWWRT